jgi:putative ABC transport system permease protein
MLRNYLKIAIRTLGRNVVFSSINIFGLALGMACSILIMLWATDERSVDRFHVNGNRIFVVYERQTVGGQVSGAYYTPSKLPEALKGAIPEIEYSCGFADGYADPKIRTFGVRDEVFNMEGVPVGPDFLTMFSYKLLHGNRETALTDPTGIAISRKMAETLFGSAENAMRKTVRFENRKDLMVNAVFADQPANASDKFDYLLNWKAWADEQPLIAQWDVNFTRTYIQLREDANPSIVEGKIRNFLYGYNNLLNKDFRIELGLQCFNDVYLHSAFENGVPTGGRIENVRLFSGVAIFILLVACINFMNLATAASIKRAREIGIRKVVGALRGALIGQFVGEALLFTFLAALIALLLVLAFLSPFNHITGKEIAFPFFKPAYLCALALLILVTGFVAGSYPAFFLSSFNPISVLKGKLRIGSGATLFRKGLVVFQFVLSILLIICSIVVSSQMDYIKSKDLGFDRENLLYIPLAGNLVGEYTVYKQRALQLPGVVDVDRISQLPHNMDFTTTLVTWEGKDPDKKVLFAPASVGYDFVKLMHLSIRQGRDLSRSFASDTSNFLINETAARKMGLHHPIGTVVSIFGKKGQIVGVLKDFHFNSLHQDIQPLLLDIKENLDFGTILVRVNRGTTRNVLAGLERINSEINPKSPFTFSFSDEEYLKLYKSEQTTSKLSGIFAALAISISCLGLLGLTAFSTQQRMREIGIRKAIGASVMDIILLFSRDFIRLVGISFILGSVVAWFIMHTWLQGFAYRIDLSWSIFLLAGICTLLIALLTISSQVIKAALLSPVKTLKAE